MSVYPYEVPLIYMDSANTNGMGGIDIIYKKEIVRKIAGKGGCEEKPINEFIQCLNDNLVKQLVKADVKCKVPALTYTEFNTSGKFWLCVGLKSAILTIFQNGLGWLCPVSAALKNPLQEFKNSFCFGCRLLPIKIRK